MVPPETVTKTEQPLIGSYPASPAGQITEEELAGLKEVPRFDLPQWKQVLRFGQRQAEFVLKGRKEFGDVFRFHGIIPGHPVITGHPDHVKSLFTASPTVAPTLTSESPLRPIVGKDSVLTARAARHLPQPNLLLPPFHGESIARYMSMIEQAI